MLADGRQAQFLDQSGRKMIGVALGHLAFDPARESLGANNRELLRRHWGLVGLAVSGECHYFTGPTAFGHRVIH